MEATEQLYVQAEGEAREGRLEQARELCEQLLARAPEHAAGWSLLGSLHQRRGDRPATLRYFERACAMQPQRAAHHNNLGVALREAGRAADAARCFREALRLDPRYAVAHNNLGLAQLVLDEDEDEDEDRMDEAAASFRQALECRPGYAKAHHNLGNALRRQGRFSEAEARLREALRLEPRYHQALNTLGVTLREQGRLDEAAGCFERALALCPDYAKALLNLGGVQAEQMRLEEALHSFRRALALTPGYVEALLAQGGVLEKLGRAGAAAASYAEAVKQQPDLAEAHLHLGNVQGQEDAVVSYDRALSLDPDLVAARVNRLDQRAELCDWRDRAQDLSRIQHATRAALDAGQAVPLAPSAAHRVVPCTAREQLAIARDTARRLAERMAPLRETLGLQHEPRQRERLRLGYLSCDFRNHAIGHLTRGLFALHDRERFEIFGYSYGPDDGSHYRHDTAADCDHFVDITGLSAAESARRMHADGIDVLVDLVGCAGNGRFEIPALRPAPVQVHYLGFPGTTGADFIDYFISDPVLTPPGQDSHFQEALALLPHSYQVNDDQQEIAPGTLTREGCGLPPEGFVFCCFNRNYKIEPGIFDVWMRILRRVPGSVLWLLETSRRSHANLEGEAAARGVDAGRLIFAKLASKPEHLVRQRLAGLFLDTPLCNAHTTASDALWAGLPLLTCPGRVFASRVAASLLTAVGLPELITSSPELIVANNKG